MPIQEQTFQNIQCFLDDYIPAQLSKWQIPGCAVAVVHKDKFILTKGYGAQNIHSKIPISKNTIFAIASCTKPITAIALGILVDEQKLAWDDLVIKHLPDFKFFDANVTQNITIRDLLSHRSGLSEKETDVLWIGNNVSPSDLIYYLRGIKPRWNFRSRFDYTNMTYVIIGQIIKRVSRKSWQEFVQQRILDPLDMTSTHTNTNQLSGKVNVATPYVIINNKLQSIDYRNLDAIASAGALNSNIIDMSHFLMMLLQKGCYNNHQIIQPKTLQEILSAHIEINNDYILRKRYPKTTNLYYGLGWFLSNYEGRLIADHGGGIDGMTTLISIVPEEELGIVVLTNAEIRLPIIVTNMIFDCLFNSKPYDWSGLLECIEKSSLHENQTFSASSTFTPTECVGIYKNDIFGDALVKIKNNALYLQFLGFDGPLYHEKDYIFKVYPSDRFLPKAIITFNIVNNSLHIFEPDIIDITCIKSSII